MSLFSITWAKDTAERVVFTAAEAVSGVYFAEQADVFSVDTWQGYGTVAAVAAFGALLKSILASKVGATGTASLVPSIEYQGRYRAA